MVHRLFSSVYVQCSVPSLIFPECQTSCRLRLVSDVRACQRTLAALWSVEPRPCLDLSTQRIPVIIE